MGHIDSGKTSLCGALSTILSTAALDKNPQSQERGITLDLQFSAMETDRFLFTFADCPGHASLIRTIIGGAQIIDMVLLVIDITKGIQTQTAEGLVIAGITVSKMLVVLNKLDLIPVGERDKKIPRVLAGIRKALEKTPFGDAPMVTFSAKEKLEGNVAELVSNMEKIGTYIVEKRNKEKEIKSSQSLLYLVDHCFPIKGKGTVITGTVLRGKVSVNDNIFIPNLALEKKVKSIQMFKKPIQTAYPGDRVGVLVTQFDSKLLERGIVCEKGTVPELTHAIVKINKISFYKLPIKSGAKFHVTVGHNTVMATFTFFGNEEDVKSPWNPEKEYLYNPNFEKNCEFALVNFETPIFCPLDSILIASKLDIDINANTCRLAFNGTIEKQIEEEKMKNLKIYKIKTKIGIVDRVLTNDTLLAKNLFNKETNMNLFVNKKISLPTGSQGTIMGSFGKSGKFKVHFPSGFGYPDPKTGPLNQNLTFIIKKYIFDKEKTIHQ
uniref:Tr-type G domain-containing protein n=1 Tax=Arcella intermedia TaxID=1963864 RepID=A0A6B2L2C5_9EUKA